MDVVNRSADVNTAQLVGTSKGEVIVQVFDWAEFLGDHFRRVPQVMSYHHLTISALLPDTVSLKQFSDSPTSEFKILRDTLWNPTSDQLPPSIKPSGLSSARLRYEGSVKRALRTLCDHVHQ